MDNLTLKSYIDFIVEELWLKTGRYKTYTNKLYAIEEMIGDSIFYVTDYNDKNMGSETLYFFTDSCVYEIQQKKGYVIEMNSKKAKLISRAEYSQNEENETTIRLIFTDEENPVVLNSHEHLSSESQNRLMEIFKLYS